ncbi:hypothetical protein RHOFW104T7_10940 [Rhodanobacter thiooxydans]|uniref:Peptidase S8/S53 domain-containing protein n=1 Tax=Rhodanobacter thiooxydans TaxID=416169 RepID=A0A154QIR6_9GAMM|nr:S8 family peptidase [Rhodanobacter thiooxydans]KZC24020.1 hypothetical protein RHOFW104T7_10940 [Rhodanobacter thiooxydans]
MVARQRFLLGRGERLTQPVDYRSGPVTDVAPYAWVDHRRLLRSDLDRQMAAFDALPSMARPGDRVVSVLRLHPQYYSRSAFPSELLRAADLRFIGSKPARFRPRAGRGADRNDGLNSTDVFVSGKRSSFAQLREQLQGLEADDPLALALGKLEQIRALEADERLQSALPAKRSALEIVMHFDPLLDADWEEQFRQYAETCKVALARDLEFQAQGLWFLAADATAEGAHELAQFAFVRAVRPMPKIRTVEAPRPARSKSAARMVSLPAGEPVDPVTRVAIFDGGLPPNHPFEKWARNIEPSPSDHIGNPIPELLDHGMAVTSAFLFGPVIQPNLPRPYTRVDHYRVLGDNLLADKQLYSVLLYVDKLLSSTRVDLANFSFGPDEVVGEDQVTAWTTMLDDHFHDRGILATIAVGNEGEESPPHNRVRVPSDCVNALAVGASDSAEAGWARAPYSCVGPGRAPGLIKPDVVAYGGCEANPFHFLGIGALSADCGTSFAAPNLLRVAAGLRAHFGRDLSNLAVRTLLIHSAENPGHPRTEVGWGQPASDPADIAICDEHSVRIVYQGTLDPSKVVRAEVPLPDDSLSGKVTIRATLCYTCRTDPNSPGDYTRSGLDIVFRPHQDKLPKPTKESPKPHPNYPKSQSFFRGAGKRTEQIQRSDGFKWDTVRHGEETLYGSSLKRPVFDVHHVARSPGASVPKQPEKLEYALVITITAKNHPELYEQVLAKYRLKLETLSPRTELPLRIEL